MTIRLMNSQDEVPYEEFLLNTDGALFYHSLPYKRFLEELLDCQSEYLISEHSGEVTGLLPLMKKRGRFGIVYNSLPYYDSHGSILSREDIRTTELLNTYHDVTSGTDVAAATLIENPFHPLPNVLWQANLYDKRISQVTPISSDTERLLASFDSSTRRNINKAKANGLTVEIDNSQLAFIHTVHIENMTAIGGKAKNQRFFDLIAKHFAPGKDYDIFIARKDGQPIAGLLLFYFKTMVEYFTPVIKEEFRTYQPLALIVFEAMVSAAFRGFNRWNWGGTWLTQEGVYRFKKKWGSVDTDYVYRIRLNNDMILKASAQELLHEYPDFYVVPFSALQAQAPASEETSLSCSTN